MAFKCIILDLDKTLIHSVRPERDKIQNPCVHLEISDNNHYNLYIRDHLQEFLEFCFENFTSVILWTAATDGYVETLLPYIPFPKDCFFHKIITRDLYNTSTKNLDFIMTDPTLCDINQVLFVDDIPHRIKNLPKKNMIVAKEFDSQSPEKDTYLLDLMQIIPML